jgi:hypothetical protein
MTIEIEKTKPITLRWERQDWEVNVYEGAKWTWAVKFDELDQVATTWRFGRGYSTYADAFKAVNFQVSRLERTGHRVHFEIIEL